MEEDIEKYFQSIDRIESQMFQKYSMDEIQAMVVILGKLLENIINKDDVKFRTINKENKVLKEKLFRIQEICEILQMHGWSENQSEQKYELKTEEYLVYAYKLRYIQIQWMSLMENRTEVEKYRAIVREQREYKIRENRTERQKQALQEQSQKDRKEKKCEIIRESRSQLNNGFGARNTTFKDIGVDLNKQKGG